LLTVGILGAYIGNLFDEIKDRPEYVIKEMMNFEAENSAKAGDDGIRLAKQVICRMIKTLFYICLVS
jgi:hypothetical protein